MNIANIMFQSNTKPAQSIGIRSNQPGASSFEAMLSKAGESKSQPEPRSEAPKSIAQTDGAGQKSKNAVRESSEDSSRGRRPESQSVESEASKKSLSEKLEELEAAIASGDSEKVEAIFAELIAFLGIDFSGQMKTADSTELQQQVQDLLVKLEQLLSNGEGQLSKLDIENISSGLEVVKELIEPLKEEHEHLFKELSAKLDDLKVKLEQKVGTETPEIAVKEDANPAELLGEKTSKAEPKAEGDDSKALEAEGRGPAGIADESESSSELEPKSTELKGIFKENLDEAAPKEVSTKVEFEKVVINQNMKLEMNHNMHTVINKEVNVEQNYLNMDKLDVIKQISAKMKLNGGDTMNEIKMKLTPESLGELTIKVTLERGIISARAIVENPYVKQVMESNMAELKQNLKSQGINFDQIDVFVGEDPDERRQAGESYQEQNRKKKRSLGGIEELDLEEAGRILGEDILSSERVDTTI